MARSPRCLDAREQIALEAVLVGHEALEIGILRIGLGHQIEQVERASGGGRQIGGDGRHDTSGRTGDKKDGVAVQGETGLAIGSGLFLQTYRPAQTFFVADFDCAGIAQGFVDQDVGDLRRLSFRFKVDRFDQSVRSLSLIRFGEAHHRATQRRGRCRRRRSRAVHPAASPTRGMCPAPQPARTECAWWHTAI